MTPAEIARRLAAILSTDVKGYSRLMGDDEVATVKTITAFRKIISSLVREHRGRVVDSPGDNLLAEFASAVDALGCAVAIQKKLKTENESLPSSRCMEFRIGINVGDVIAQDDRLYGDGVNIAARLEGLSLAGGVCISGTVYDQVKNKLDLTYQYLGEKQVKNIADPVRAYQVVLEPGTASAGKPGHKEPADAGESELKLPDMPSIAVMPLKNLSRDPEQDFFSDGLTEDIITDLSKISGLFVIAKNSVFAYKGQAVMAPQVASELGVRHILEGSVRRAGSRVRISTQLVDAPRNQNVWAERFDGNLEDIFDLQDQVTSQIVNALKVKLTPMEKERQSPRGAVNPEAYDLVHRANRLGLVSTFDAHLEAQGMFQKATELDPAYAPAYVGLGWTWFDQWPFGWSENRDVLNRALELARKAIGLDQTLPDAYILKSCTYLWMEEHGQAEKSIRQVLAFSPNNADAISFLGNILTFAGRPQEALAPIERAMRLDPGDQPRYRMYLGHAYCLLGRYQEAENELKPAAAKYPEYLPLHNILTRIYVAWGKMDQARRQAARIKEVDPGFSSQKLEKRLPYKDPAHRQKAEAAFREVGL